MELYNEKINEFIDWVEGKNVLTNAIETLNSEGQALKVSGEQIRKLIQEKLRRPIYANEGNDNMIRLFSSEEAYLLWVNADDGDDYKKDLVLFEFALPSLYKVKTSGLQNGEIRHIIYGDKDSQAARVMFTWGVALGDEYTDDTIAVTYKVENSLYTTPKSRSVIYTNRNESVIYDLSEYLELGENTITVQIKGQNTGASATFTFTMMVVSLNISSQFRFYSATSDIITIPYRLERNDYSENVVIKIYIDGELVKSETKYKGDTNSNGNISIDNSKNQQGIRSYESSIQSLILEEKNKIHNLLILAETVYNGTPFKSNLLYYDFVVPADAPVANAMIVSFVNYTSAQSQISPFLDLTLLASLFKRINLEWAYYTDLVLKNTSVSITWKLQKGEDASENIQLIPLSIIDGNKGQQSSDLSFEPSIYSEENIPVYLNAYIGETRIRKIPMFIEASEISVNETGGYALKISAAGKTNQSSDRKVWATEGTEIFAEFSNNIRWDDSQGWYNNSLRISGIDNYVTINYNPFIQYSLSDDSTSPQAEGRTIELEFEVEKTVSENDTVILIGGDSGTRIEIKPSKAVLYNSLGEEIITTNYKDNERIKIAFIINGSTILSVDRNLIYIVTNGILERASLALNENFVRASGNIKIGGSRSGIKFYSMRVYRGPISYMSEYNNYVFDSDNKALIASKNDIFDNSGNISYDKCRNKIDTILISGNLNNILSANSDKERSETDVTISRHCPTDTTKDFVCEGCRIRKHGQSTLFYPITSMKIWFNKSVNGNTPRFSCPDQSSLGLAKNRYKMKNSSIPANKFVLQANYADSSGVHNGGLLRLILNTWYNAKINNKFLLRTEPQLFSSISSEDKSLYGMLNTWKDYSNGRDFPYNLEIGANSFPCVVFYENTEADGKVTYLGQYVFMEDKKSDFNYGERSIYKTDPKDPFCLTTANKKGDSEENKVWDNSHVLRIEVVNVNTPFVSYMNDHITEHGEYRDCMLIIEPQQSEEEESLEVLKERHYRWEEDFELIYPDPEDIEGRPVGYYTDSKGNLKYQSVDTTKFANNSKFVEITQPFIIWFRWLTSTYNNHEKFREEAEDHLDLYKLAAYYIFFMRFGLVDSVERNVQLKTYDGVHWHYEPWDMDIALGNRNTGGIAFDPPIDRDTRNPGDNTSWALSGRSSTTSNWLWDALEAWPYWTSIVKIVADALYQAGLTYEQCIEMFDNEYANKWCETIYNKSGYFKYIESGNGSKLWLAWLQGSRTPHRHWWLSTSMDYYDARWKVGDYMNHFIQYRGTHAINDPATIAITALRLTYFSIENDTSTLITIPSETEQTQEFNMTSYAITDRNNIKFYGAKNMESFVLGGLSDGLSTINVAGAYSDVLGACLKTLDLGTTLTLINSSTYTGSVNPRAQEVNISYTTGNKNALYSLLNLNIRGQLSIPSLTPYIFNDSEELLDLTSIKNIYALGSGLRQFSSSYGGNAFNKIELPDTIVSIYMRNSNWNILEFWKTGEVSGTEINLVDENDLPILNPSTGELETILKNITTITKVNSIPSTITTMNLLGSTGHYKCSKDLVLNWINSIITDNSNNSDALSEYSLTMDDILWDSNTCGANGLLTYEELGLIAKLNGLANETDPELKAAKRSKLRGYICLAKRLGDLSIEELSQIRTWFGDSVFTLSAKGSGLVIDYAYEYSQISLGEPAYYSNGEFYLKEGNSATLNVTSFYLSENIVENPWYINIYVDGQIKNVPLTEYSNISINMDAEGVYRVYVSEGSGLSNKVYIYTMLNGTKVGIPLNIIPVTYPNTFSFDILYGQGMEDRSSNGILNMYDIGNTIELYLHADQLYDATVLDVVFTISEDNGNPLLDNINKSYTLLRSEYSSIDTILLYSKASSINSLDKWGLRLNTNGILPLEAKYYTITASIKFKYSGKNTIKTIKLLVQDDSIIIVSSASGDELYLALANSWEILFGETAPVNLYKKHLSSLRVVYFNSNATLSGSFVYYSNNGDIESLLTLLGDSILRYLTGVEELYFNKCINLEKEFNGIDLFDFSLNIELKTINFERCDSLIGTIDLSNNLQILNVYSYYTTSLNINIPNNSLIKQLHFGNPTLIIINGAPNLLNISSTSSSNLTNLQLINIGNTYHGRGFGVLTYINPSSLETLIITLLETESISSESAAKLKNIIEYLELDSSYSVNLFGTINCTAVFREVLTYLLNLKYNNSIRYEGLTVNATEIYNELEYISSTSGAGLYIKFNKVTPLRINGLRNVNFDVEMKFEISSSNPGVMLSAAAGGNARNYFGILIAGTDDYLVKVYSNSTQYLSRDNLGSTGNIITLDHLKNTEAYSVCANSGYKPLPGDVYYHPLGLFAKCDSGVSNYCVGKVYYIKVWYPQNTLVYDCIPVKSSNGNIGLYNKVDGELLTSLLNSFQAGPEIIISPIEIEEQTIIN